MKIKSRTVTAWQRDPLSIAPLIGGVVGTILAGIDLLPGVKLPSGYGDNVLLLAASALLVTIFLSAQTRAVQFAQQSSLLGRVEQLVSDSTTRQVPSDEIAGLLSQELKASSSWYFRGGSGRWLRRDVLPELAKRTAAPARIKIQLLDPRDKHLCTQYADYRNKQRDLSDRRPNEDDPRTIQADILASILAAVVYKNHSRIEPDVVLLRTYSPIRVDAGDSSLLVTVASKRAPGLLARKAGIYYVSTIDEIENAHHGNDRLDFSGVPTTAHPQQLTGEDARKVLELCTVREPIGTHSQLLIGFASVEHLDFDEIARLAIHVDQTF